MIRKPFIAVFMLSLFVGWFCSCAGYGSPDPTFEYEVHVSDLKNDQALKSFMQKVNDDYENFEVSKKIGDFVFSVSYVPIEIIALRELAGDSANRSAFNHKIKELEGMSYYRLSIKNVKYEEELLRYNLAKESDYYARLNYFSFDFQNTIHLVEGNDTLHCDLFHFERTFGLNSELKFSLAFANSSSTQKKTFILEDKVFNNGTIKLEFSESIYKHKPKINLIDL